METISWRIPFRTSSEYLESDSNYRNEKGRCNKKAPTDHHRKPIWLTARSLWEPWPWRDEDKDYFFFPATLMWFYYNKNHARADEISIFSVFMNS
jgi:hypothetical protein